MTWKLPTLQFIRIPGIPLVEPGANLAGLITSALRAAGEIPTAGDVVAVAQKIVSKAEGRIVRLATVEPSPRAARSQRWSTRIRA